MTEMQDSASSSPTPPITVLAKIARWIGLLLFLAVGWLYLVSGLMAPMWAVGILWVVWVALLVAVIRLWRRPWMVVWVAVASYLIWAGVMLFGDFVLGWTA